jgi:Zn-dependent peptidase ImmA (M78 family)
MQSEITAQSILEEAQKRTNARLSKSRKRLSYIYKHLKYDDFNLPKLSRIDIEEIAELFLMFYSPTSLETPSPTPIESLIDSLKQNNKLSFSIANDLPVSEDSKVLGLTHLSDKSIVISESILEQPIVFNYVVAHELGHLFLHTNKPVIDDKKRKIKNVIDNESNFIYIKRNLDSMHDWIEWQANSFAASLLLPHNMLKVKLKEIQEEIGINRNRGIIYIEEKDYSKRDFDLVLSRLTKTFQVSKTVCQIRLHNLNLIHDRIKKEIEGYKIEYLLNAFYSRSI